MELFLLLSIGMSIVTFISIALNQAPAPQPAADQKPEPVFPLESYLFASDQLNLLKLNEEVLLQDLEANEKQDTLIQREASLIQKEVQPAF